MISNSNIFRLISLLEEAPQRPCGGFLRGTAGAAAAAGAPQRGEPLVARHHPRERREDGAHARVVAFLVCVDTQIRQHRDLEVLVDGMYRCLQNN